MKYDECFDVLCNLLSSPSNELYIKSVTIFNRMRNQQSRFTTENVGNNLSTSQQSTFAYGLKPKCLTERISMSGKVICDCPVAGKICYKKRMYKQYRFSRNGGYKRGRGSLYRGRGHRGRGQ